MDITRILAELKKQRRALGKAIAALEGVSPKSQKLSPSSRRLSNGNKSRQKSSAASATHTSGPSPDPMAKVLPFRRIRRRQNSQRQAEQA